VDATQAFSSKRRGQLCFGGEILDSPVEPGNDEKQRRELPRALTSPPRSPYNKKDDSLCEKPLHLSGSSGRMENRNPLNLPQEL
jgi:hypothetical protein